MARSGPPAEAAQGAVHAPPPFVTAPHVSAADAQKPDTVRFAARLALEPPAHEQQVGAQWVAMLHAAPTVQGVLSIGNSPDVVRSEKGCSVWGECGVNMTCPNYDGAYPLWEYADVIDNAVAGTLARPSVASCRLTPPFETTMVHGYGGDPVYAQVEVPGCTDTPARCPFVKAQLGSGGIGVDPSQSPDAFDWVEAAYAPDQPAAGGHAYRASVGRQRAPGDYAYAFRFSTDSGASWTYCDRDGTGAFRPDRLGHITQIASRPVDACVLWKSASLTLHVGETATIFGRAPSGVPNTWSAPRHPLSCSITCALLVATRVGLASEPAARAVDLSWTAPPGCPTAESVDREIAALLPGSPSAGARHARAVVENAGDRGWTLDLTTDIDGRTSHREIRAPSCPELVAALATVLAIDLDPSEHPSPDAPPTPADPSPRARDARDGSATNSEATNAPELRAPARERAVASPAGPGDAPFALVATAGGSVGATANPAFGLMLGAAWRSGRARVEVDGLWFLASHVDRTELNIGGDFGLWLGGVAGCYAPVAGRLQLSACAGAEAGALIATGSASSVVTSTTRRSTPWIAAKTGALVVFQAERLQRRPEPDARCHAPAESPDRSRDG